MKKLISFLLALVLVLSLTPMMAFAETGPSLETNIGTKEFVAGDSEYVEFTFSTVAGTGETINVYGSSDFGEIYKDKLESLQYYEINDDKWYDLSGKFGSDTGFPLTNATSTFRAKFKDDAEGDYTFTAAMYAVVNNTTVCSIEVPFKVLGPAAKINETEYARLTQAVANATNGDTIELLRDSSGDGIILPKEKFATGITLDLNGYTYTIDGKLVGSSGTESNGFQLLQGNSLTICDGTIKMGPNATGTRSGVTSKAKILIQNYSNLTLAGVTLDGTNCSVTTPYALSNVNGKVTINDSEIIAATGGVAFDMDYKTPDYPNGTQITVENSKVLGIIEIPDRAKVNDCQSTLTIQSGAFTDLQTAVNYAANGATIKLADNLDTHIIVPENAEITLDLNGKTLNGKTVSKTPTITNNGSLIIVGDGTIKREDTNGTGYYVVQNIGTLTFAEEFTGLVTNGSGSDSAHAGASLIDNGSSTTRATLTINGGSFKQDKFNVIKTEDKSIININGGEISAVLDFAVLSYDELNISDGKINGSVCTRTYGDLEAKTNISGGEINGPVISVKYNSSAMETPHVTITGGLVKELLTDDPVINTDVKGEFVVSGGAFATHPLSSYIAEGYQVVANTDPATKDAYPCAIGELAQGQVAADVASGAAQAESAIAATAPEEVKELASAAAVAAAGSSVEGLGVLESATEKASANTVTAGAVLEGTTTVAMAITEKLELSEAVQASEVAIVIQTYPLVKVTDVTTNGATSVGSIKFEIEIMAQTFATTKERLASDEAITTQNAVMVGSPSALQITEPVTVEIPLPDSFGSDSGKLADGAKLYVKHIKSNGDTYIYGGKIIDSGEKYALTFVNPHGFSEFELLPEDPTVARIGEIGYLSLADAVAAVKNNETIVLATDVAVDVNVAAVKTFKLSPASFSFTGQITVSSGLKLSTSGSDGITTYTVSVIQSADSSNAAPAKKNYKNCSKGNACVLSIYKDLVASQWYHDGIHYCIENGIMNGVASDEFAPDASANRGMIVTMLARLEGVPCKTVGQAWYKDGQDWAVKNNVSDGTAMENAITREQLATMLYRYAKLKGKGFTGLWLMRLDFNDANLVSDWAYEAVCWCKVHGITDGKPGNVFDPCGLATRAEVATMFMRLEDALK